MSSVSVPPGKQTFLDPDDGKLLSLGTVTHYVPSTTTFKNTWADEAQSQVNQNPITLDASASCSIWGEGLYRQILRDSGGNVIWDRVTGFAEGSSGDVSIFDTRSQAQAAEIEDSINVVDVGGYYLPGDGGAAEYARVLTPSSYGFTDASGGYWEVAEREVRPEQFGAKADGATNDAVAIQLAINYAVAKKATLLLTAGATYRFTATLSLPSGLVMDGYGAILSFGGGNIVAMASKGYLDNTAPSGRQRIRGLRLSAVTTGNAAQHGLVIRDYWGIYEDIEVQNFGGSGLYFTDTSASGSIVGGTLVENRIVRPAVRLCAGISIYLGRDGNNKLTDGFLEDPIIQQPGGCLNQAIYCGSAAGWVFTNGHTYGAAPTTAVEIRNSYFTKFEGFYVEGFDTNAFLFAATQNALAIGPNRANAQSAVANASVVRVGRSGAFAAPNVAIGAQSIRQPNDIQIRGVLTESAAIVVKMARPVVDGNAGATAGGSAFVTKFASLGANTNNIQQALMGRMDNIFTDTPADGRLFYNSMPLPNYNKAAAWSGAVAQSIDFVIPVLDDFDGLNLLVAIYARTFHNGAITSKALYSVYVKSKNNGADAWTVQADLIPLAGQTAVVSPGVGACTVTEAPTGFGVAPVFTIANVGSAGTLTCAFTPGGANPFGEIKFGEIAGRASH